MRAKRRKEPYVWNAEVLRFIHNGVVEGWMLARSYDRSQATDLLGKG